MLASADELSATCLDHSVVAAFVDGSLPDGERDRVEQHIDGCAPCRTVVSNVVRTMRSSSDLPPTDKLDPVREGSLVGRFVVKRLLGSGAMGLVFEAFDPKLDRSVALKLVRDPSPISRERLEREAQLAARLQDPNVVSIHDVGTIGDEVFIAMEYVEGVTLAEWSREAGRTTAEVIATFRQAARALQAAHDVGLVHRDFKPTNALVGRDGRLRVLDFGLARAMQGSSDSELAAGSPPVDSSPSSLRLSQTGMAIGSPRYMSPEQYRGERADARSDQFAFCVALYEALYAARPFPGDTIAELSAQVLAGRVQAPPRFRRVPAHTRRAILRGMSLQPELRFPSMAALSAALDPKRSPVRYVVAGVAVAAAIAGGLWLRSTLQHRDLVATCEHRASDVRAMWTDRRARVHDAFLATHASFAQSTFDATDRVFAANLPKLADQLEGSCLANDDTPEVADARQRCFEDRLHHVTAALDAFDHVDAPTLITAVNTTWTATGGSCSDVRTLLTGTYGAGRVPAPLLHDIEHVESLVRSRQVADATAAIEPIVARARAAGDHASLFAALDVLGDVQRMNEHTDDAIKTYQEVLALAEADGRDDDAAKTLLKLADELGQGKSDAPAAHRYVDLARAKLSRIKDADLGVEAMLHRIEATIFLYETRMDEAVHELQLAAATYERAYGGDHPEVGKMLNMLVEPLAFQNKRDEAIRAGTRSIEILTKALGPDHPDVASALTNFSRGYMHFGMVDDARRELVAGEAIDARALPPDDPQTLRAKWSRAELEMRAGNFAMARTLAGELIASYAKVAGPDSPEVAMLHDQIGKAFSAESRFADAAAEYEKSLAMLEHSGIKDHLQLLTPLLDLAQAKTQLGLAKESVPLGERALAMAKAESADPMDVALSSFVLAVALWETGDHVRSRAMAEQARDAYPPEQRHDVDGWLAEHPIKTAAR